MNAAAEELGKVLATVIGLRARRGAILRDGVERASQVASSELEQVALTGPYEAAVAELCSLHLETECVNEDPGRSWSSMSPAEQESVIGLVPDEPVDASTLRGRWEQYERLIADLQARRDAEVVAVLQGSTLRAVGADLGVSHVMVAKIAERAKRRAS